MAKRSFEDGSESDGAKRVKFDNGDVKKHSLDSDEEDDYAQGKNYDIMLDDDIEGQEESTLTYDGATKITPFNMKEELEEGHFDVDGNYHWQKDKVVADAWIENIDDYKIVERPIVSDTGSESNDGVPFDSVSVYKQLLRLMKPGETVKKTLCRLGGKKPMLASERWKKKKAGEACEDSYNRSQVVEVTELADRLLTELGNMDIYQETYEHITRIVNDADSKNCKSKVKTSVLVDDVLDMYADDFDEKEKGRLAEKSSDAKQSNVGIPESTTLKAAE